MELVKSPNFIKLRKPSRCKTQHGASPLVKPMGKCRVSDLITHIALCRSSASSMFFHEMTQCDDSVCVVWDPPGPQCLDPFRVFLTSLRQHPCRALLPLAAQHVNKQHHELSTFYLPPIPTREILNTALAVSSMSSSVGGGLATASPPLCTP